MEQVVSKVRQRPAPIEGQSHWCEGGNVEGTVCWRVVGNSDDHCELGHANTVITPPRSRLGQVLDRLEDPSTCSLPSVVSELVPEPPQPLPEPLSWEEFITEAEQEGGFIGILKRGGPEAFPDEATRVAARQLKQGIIQLGRLVAEHLDPTSTT